MALTKQKSEKFLLRENESVLVTGGVRSGKSRFAEKLAAHFKRVLYLATAQALDPEMQQRIELHQLRRDSKWKTLEEPIDLLDGLQMHDQTFNLVLIDCITFWISNLMEKKLADKEILSRVDALADYLLQPSVTTICVTNEVGAGIVPDYPSGRRFRDLVGTTNQRLAEACHVVFWMVSGIPLQVK